MAIFLIISYSQNYPTLILARILIIFVRLIRLLGSKNNIVEIVFAKVSYTHIQFWILILRMYVTQLVFNLQLCNLIARLSYRTHMRENFASIAY